MKFPVQISTIDHNHGGKITRVVGIGHKTDRPKDGRSRDYWFFLADVAWSDGTNSEDAEVMPYSLCCDAPGKNAELDALLGAMNEYLGEHGEWFDTGKHQGWYAHRKERSAA